MSLLQAIFLGIVQGVTEFLPVSSSGHLAIFQNIFDMKTDGGLLFDVCLHIGTLAAVFIVYWKDIFKMIREFFRMCGDIIRNVKIFYRNRRYDEALRYHRIIHNNYRKFVLLVLVSTIPTGIIGVMGKDLISFASTTLIVPGVCLLLTGLLLLVADHCKDGKKIPKDISYSNGFLIGIAQGLATLPGLSRSGTTIAACLLSGFDRRFAVKYSFIMSIPAVLGAAVLELKDIGSETISGGLVTNCVVGAIVSGVVGYICIRTMLVVVRKRELQGLFHLLFRSGSRCDHRSFYCIKVRGDIHGSKERDRNTENHREKADGFQEAVCFFGEENIFRSQGKWKGTAEKEGECLRLSFCTGGDPLGDAGPLCDPLYQQFRNRRLRR